MTAPILTNIIFNTVITCSQSIQEQQHTHTTLAKMDVLLGTESVINNLDGHINLDNAYCMTKNTKITNLYCGVKLRNVRLFLGRLSSF